MSLSTKRKNILLTVLVLALSGGFISFYMYNKEGPDVESANAAKVSATALYWLFVKDSVSAKKQYAEKVLLVSGTVTGVSANQQAQPVILLKTGTQGASINCTLEGPATDIKKGDMVSIKGWCNGLGQGDADLGIAADVYLSRCYLER